MMDFIGWLIAAILLGVTIELHYSIIRLVSDVVMPWVLHKFHDRRVMMLMIVTLMLGHITEIWMFAITMYVVSLGSHIGYLSGPMDNDFNTYLYFSAVNYTALGSADISPHGALRSLSVSEALTGLLMIAWSASFTYLKMEQLWSMRRQKKQHDGHISP